MISDSLVFSLLVQSNSPLCFHPGTGVSPPRVHPHVTAVVRTSLFAYLKMNESRDRSDSSLKGSKLQSAETFFFSASEFNTRQGPMIFGGGASELVFISTLSFLKPDHKVA